MLLLGVLAWLVRGVDLPDPRDDFLERASTGGDEPLSPLSDKVGRKLKFIVWRLEVPAGSAFTVKPKQPLL